ncbi:FYVE-domain-containing protein [Rhizoclosmatium globosum]|uniref:FYVE-domain-containing protein n=1 Tax=Rhizoclosmatium globosum TaxID=329046 RepID=A0A1Y2CRC1_9FUNG|nr:FYVE-domain-containing protein [Rhizoclosmatium globosum]|eukprot:ORY49590.1 FYVE-domain-containing protein [Rhizoclosmatium globosum]
MAPKKPLRPKSESQPSAPNATKDIELEKLRAELENADKRKEITQGVIALLKQQNQDLSNRLKAMLEGGNINMDSLDELADSQTTQSSAATATVAALESAKESLESQVAALEAANKQYEAALRTANARAVGLEEDCEAALADAADSRNLLAAVEQEADKLRGLASKHEDAVAALRDATEKQAAEFAAKLAALAAERDALARKLSDATSQLTNDFNAKSAAYEKELNATREHLQAVELRAVTAETSATKAEKAAQDLRAQIKALESHASQSAKTIADLKAKLDKPAPIPPPKSLEQDLAKIKALEAHVNQLQELVRNREVELHSGIQDRDRLHKELVEKDSTISVLRAVLKDLESGVVKVLQGPLVSSLKVGVVSKDIHRFKQDHWASDSSTPSCSQPSCNVQFGVYQRKHHCRCCGMIFCSTHSGKKMKLSLASHQFDVNGVETRVCDGCYSAVRG